MNQLNFSKLIPNLTESNFIIYTDKDDTIDVDDKNFNSIISNVKKIYKGTVVWISGRTIGDTKSLLSSRNITLPDIIVGDNGATYEFTESGYKFKLGIKHEKILELIDEYSRIGGNINNIRFTNGENVFVQNTPDTRNYYKNNHAVIFVPNIIEKMQATKDITKITLTDTQNIINNKEFLDALQKLDFWTDSAPTRFPDFSGLIRMDIASNTINKGKAVQALNEVLTPKLGYVCIGNGNNDIPMFKQAIDDGQIVAVMENSDPGLIEYIQNYAQNKSALVFVIPAEKTLANNFINTISQAFYGAFQNNFYKIPNSNLFNQIKKFKK